MIVFVSVHTLKSVFLQLCGALLGVNLRSLGNIVLRIKSPLVKYPFYCILIIDCWGFCECIQLCLVLEDCRGPSDVLDLPFFAKWFKDFTGVGGITVSFDEEWQFQVKGQPHKLSHSICYMVLKHRRKSSKLHSWTDLQFVDTVVVSKSQWYHLFLMIQYKTRGC